jgi:hypothetical protein
VNAWTPWRLAVSLRGDARFAGMRDQNKDQTALLRAIKTQRPFSGPPISFEKILSISISRNVKTPVTLHHTKLFSFLEIKSFRDKLFRNKVSKLFSIKFLASF